jgi:AcrR family transcriptional regulator
MTESPVESKRYHHGDLRRALVEAAERILENEGPSALSLRAVAREAGVSAAAPYHHFKDKNELLAAIAQEGFELLAKAMSAAAEGEGDPRARLNALGVAYVCFARDNPALYTLMYSSARDRDQRAGGPFGLVKAAMVAAGAEGLDAADLELAQIAAWCAAHGLAEMAGSREFDVVKTRLGGDEAFFGAVLAHLSLYRWR